MWDKDVQDRKELKLVSNYVQKKIIFTDVQTGIKLSEMIPICALRTESHLLTRIMAILQTQDWQ